MKIAAGQLVCDVLKRVAESAYEGREALTIEMAKTSYGLSEIRQFESYADVARDLRIMFDTLMTMNKKQLCQSLI